MGLKFWVACAAASFGLTTLVASSPVMAEEKKAQGKAQTKAKLGAPGTLPKKIAIAPEGLHFGLGINGVSKLYEKHFDKEFLPKYQKAHSTVDQEALDAELKEMKALILRSKVEFADVPTGVDQTPLKPEYSYMNGESMAKVPLKNGTRYFFFFTDKLWKVYDEYKLVAGGPLGNTFDTAIEALTKRFGAPPKKIAETDSAPQEAQWVGSDMIIRAIDRGNVLAVVYIEKDTQDDLPKLRRNRPKNEHAMDRDVSAALKSNAPPEPPKNDKDKAKKK
jgi:hypothetical protein